MLINVTGNGKGKSTSAFGMAARALGWNWQVALLQFIKGEMETGEMRFFRGLKLENFIFKQLGAGLTRKPGQHREMAMQGWAEAKKLLQDENLQLLILDEFNIALHQGYLEVEEVIAELRNRRTGLHVMMTGRYANEKLLAICDLVSDIHAVRHPLEQGMKAEKGIDY